MVTETDPSGEQVEVSAESVIVSIDPPKVERIVENLLVNAIKHTPAGTSVLVTVTGSEQGV